MTGPAPQRAAEQHESRRLEAPEDGFTVEVHPGAARAVVVPRGELDVATVDAVAASMEDVVGQGFRELVLDLRGLVFMDSTGLRLVLDQALREDVRVSLIDGAEPVSRLFDITNVRSRLRFEAPA